MPPHPHLLLLTNIITLTQFLYQHQHRKHRHNQPNRFRWPKLHYNHHPNRMAPYQSSSLHAWRHSRAWTSYRNNRKNAMQLQFSPHLTSPRNLRRFGPSSRINFFLHLLSPPLWDILLYTAQNLLPTYHPPRAILPSLSLLVAHSTVSNASLFVYIINVCRQNKKETSCFQISK